MVDGACHTPVHVGICIIWLASTYDSCKNTIEFYRMHGFDINSKREVLFSSLVAVLLMEVCTVPLWGSGCLQFSVPQKETLESS